MSHLFNQDYNILWEHFVLRVYCTYLLACLLTYLPTWPPPVCLPVSPQVRSFCQTPHKLMNRVTATLTLTLTITDTGGAVLTLMLGYRLQKSTVQRIESYMRMSISHAYSLTCAAFNVKTWCSPQHLVQQCCNPSITESFQAWRLDNNSRYIARKLTTVMTKMAAFEAKWQSTRASCPVRCLTLRWLAL